MPIAALIDKPRARTELRRRMIDITFDFRQDTPAGRDPDAYSKTLRRYHRTLWSKELPSGERSDLDDTKSGAYLRHASPLGEFVLTSDAVVPTFRKERSLAAARWSRCQTTPSRVDRLGPFATDSCGPIATARRSACVV